MFKTNDSRDRVGYGSLLLPPQGYHLSLAVGTTYSLDLEALTAVCMSLGLTEDTDSSMLNNPITLLNALQKTSEKMIVFCEGGQIKMPSNPSTLSLLLEKVIIPVMLPKAKGIQHYPAFHPKTWIIRYENDAGDYKYRFAVLSRNLTFDRSWDVCFAMDSSEDIACAEKSLPLTHYLEFLREQVDSKHQDARGKRATLRKLAEELQTVSFTTDSKEFGSDFEIMPLGIGTHGYQMEKDPLFCKNHHIAKYSFHELVVFSPFISGSLIEHWNDGDHTLTGTSRVLITRKSELSKVTSEQADKFLIYTLKDDIVDGEDAISSENENKQKQDIHAKIYLRRKYQDVDLYLGSMNATYSAVYKNVEMMIRLRTRQKHYSGEELLENLFCGKADDPHNPFELSEPVAAEKDEIEEATNKIEQIVKMICRMLMEATVTAANDKYNVDVKITGKLPDAAIYLSPFRRSNLPIEIKNEMQFLQLDLLQLSEFYMLKVVSDGVAIERIIMIPTKGIPDIRENAVVNSVVKDKRSFVEYVAFVLGDNYLLSALEEMKLKSAGTWTAGHEQMPALYEKMLKTALEDPDRLKEIGYLLSMITDDGIIPDEFRELYETFKKTLKIK